MAILSGEQILQMMLAYQVPCVLAAAADLDLFQKLAATPRSALQVASAAGCDLRGITILLDALAAVGMIIKQDGSYSLSSELAPFLDEESPQSVIAMLRHQANCLRRWSRLPWTVHSGRPDYPGPSIRGAEADNTSSSRRCMRFPEVSRTS